MEKEKIVCTGYYYNFKKGFENCKNRNECKYYNENAIRLMACENYDKVYHNYINDFRKCKKHKES